MPSWDPKQDESAAARGIRFGCGAVAGVLLVVTEFRMRWLGETWGVAAACICIVACGWLAMRLGDRFWSP